MKSTQKLEHAGLKIVAKGIQRCVAMGRDATEGNYVAISILIMHVINAKCFHQQSITVNSAKIIFAHIAQLMTHI